MQLVAEDLTCVRGGRRIFSGLSFAVGAGQALAVTGPNGAGKSSLLRLLAGLVGVERGTLTLKSGAPDRTIPEQSHYLGHQDALKPSLTVAENLGFWMRYLGADQPGATSKSAVHHALAVVGLAGIELLPAGYLSAGQRRRLSLARLLAVSRPIWLLDEPTAALDAAAQILLAGMMRDHLATGGLIVAATHGPLGLENQTELRLGEQMP